MKVVLIAPFNESPYSTYIVMGIISIDRKRVPINVSSAYLITLHFPFSLTHVLV